MFGRMMSSQHRNKLAIVLAASLVIGLGVVLLSATFM